MELSTKHKFKEVDKKIAKQAEEISELREAVILQTRLVKQLLDEKKGLEATVQTTIDTMFKEQLEIEIDYEVTREALEALSIGGINKA